MTPLLAFLSLSINRPGWLWLLVLVPVMVIPSLRLLRAIPPFRRFLSITVRALLIVAITLCVADVEYVRESDALTVMFLMDRSNSVKGLQATQEAYLHAVDDAATPKDRVGVIDFARNAFVQQPPIRGGYVIPPGRLPDMDHRDRTDVAAALRLAVATFPSDSAKRIVLLSDGNDNMGDVLAEAAVCQAEGIAIDIVPLWYDHGREVYFDRMIAPTQVEEEALIPLRMVLHAEQPTTGRVDVYHNGTLVPIPEDLSRIQLQAGNNPFILKIPAEGTGAQRFEARFVPDNPERDDAIEENNAATTFSFVSGKGRVLVLSTNPADDQSLVDALRGEKIDIDLRDVSASPINLLDLINYSAVVLANVPANVFTEEQHEALTNYVSNLGGGLIMTGGDESFGAGGWIGSPVAEIMPVHFEIKHKRVIPRGALVLIMHSCEIPRGNYWGTEVAKKSVDTISSRDYIGVCSYSWSQGGEYWNVPIQIASNKNAVKQRIDKISIGDMPSFAPTLNMAVRDLKATDAAQRHIIIISDGDPSPPNASDIREMIKYKITCSTVGIGYGSHVIEATMRDIAKKTGGKFYACRNPRLLPQIFVKESRMVRRSLISEEAFTPQVQYAFSELLAGINTQTVIPPLGGMVLTSPKSTAQTALVRLAKDGTRDPVLAHWQAGLGKAVAFTSGYWPYWGGSWVNWTAYSKLWAQIVRWSMRQDAPANFDVFTRVDGNQGRIVIDAMGQDAGALNMLDLPAMVIRPDQSSAPLRFSQTGPGRYEAEFPIDQTGQYIASVAVNEQGKAQGTLQTGIAVPFSPEYRELKTNEALLRRMQEMTGGRWHDNLADASDHGIFTHDLPPVRTGLPVWDWVLGWIVLALFLLDVAIRRLASWLALSVVVEVLILVVLLFGVGTVYGPWWGILGTVLLAELIGWSIRARSIVPMFESLTGTTRTLAEAADRSTATVGQLRDLRDRVRAPGDENADTAPSSGQPIASTDQAVDRERRFDAGDAPAVPPADLAASLGEKPASSADSPAPGEPSSAAGGDDEDATSRLLRAKRRARRGMDGDKGDQGGEGDKPSS